MFVQSNDVMLDRKKQL